MTEVDERPIHAGGMMGCLNNFGKNMKYPPSGQRIRGFEAQYVALFLVKKRFHYRCLEIFGGIGGICDEEAGFV